jgi:hypothetical protein
MKSWRLLGQLLVLGCFVVATGCGGEGGNGSGAVIAFTPAPTPTPIPKLCGNGTIDPAVGEQCESDGDCSGGATCVCCLCLQPDQELGEREFSVADPPSQFVSSALGGNAVSRAGTWLPSVLNLVAGRPDPNLPGEEACSAPVALAEDVLLGFSPIDSSVACTKVFADGSMGVIDCDGGTAQGIEYSQNSNGAGANDEPMIMTGAGDAATAGPGAASFTVPRAVTINLPAAKGFTTADCMTLDYDDPLNPDQLAALGIDETKVTITPLGFTTTMATGIVLNPKTASGMTAPMPIVLSTTGMNFTCGGWTVENGPGVLVAPISGLDQAVVGDTMNTFVLVDGQQASSRSP